jgi:hypothetical protein
MSRAPKMDTNTTDPCENPARSQRWLWRIVSASELCEAAEALHLCSLMELAWLSHECEQHNDDVTMMTISEEVEKRIDRTRFAELYRSLWPKHAKARGYDGANMLLDRSADDKKGE